MAISAVEMNLLLPPLEVYYKSLAGKSGKQVDTNDICRSEIGHTKRVYNFRTNKRIDCIVT